MFHRQHSFQSCLLICVAAIIFHYLVQQEYGSNNEETNLHNLKASLLKLGSFHSIIFCHCRLYTGTNLEECAILGNWLQCQQPTFCILWKTSPSFTELRELLQTVNPRFELLESDTGSPVKNCAHFLLHLQEKQLHFTNVIQQEDGSWWFDAISSKESRLIYDRDQFYVGKYQGWLKNVSVQRGAVLDAPTDRHALRRLLLTSRYFPCDARAAHRFHLAEGRDASAAGRRFRHHAWRLLAAAAAALDELDVPFWLSSGTCLGYYRQCDFVPYMGDVDIGVRIATLRDFAGDQSLPSIDQLISAMAARRLRLVHRFGRPSDSLELCFRSPDNIKLDIFFFYDDGEIMWNGGTQARTGLKFRYDFPAFSLCWTEFLELRVRVPCDTERYLRANYGPDWRTPRADWDWKSSPPNVRPNGAWLPAEMAEVVQLIET